MKIASIGLNSVVPAPPEDQSVQAPSIKPVHTLENETPFDLDDSEDTAKFSRMFDLIQKAEKKGKLKYTGKNKKHARFYQRYMNQKEFPVKEIKGTVFNNSA